MPSAIPLAYYLVEMTPNRVLKFDNFVIGGTLEQLDIGDPEEVQIWADHDLAILVENRCGIIEDFLESKEFPGGFLGTVW